MKEQIIESLKQTYSAKYGADDSFISGQADAILATGVTEETMANAVAGVESSFRAYQSFQDKHRAEKARLEKELEELKKASQTQTVPPTTPTVPTKPSEGEESETLKILKLMMEKQEQSDKTIQAMLMKDKMNAIQNEAVKAINNVKVLDGHVSKTLANVARAEVLAGITVETDPMSVGAKFHERYAALMKDAGQDMPVPGESSGGPAKPDMTIVNKAKEQLSMYEPEVAVLLNKKEE